MNLTMLSWRHLPLSPKFWLLNTEYFVAANMFELFLKKAGDKKVTAYKKQ